MNPALSFSSAINLSPYTYRKLIVILGNERTVPRIGFYLENPFESGNCNTKDLQS
jgi:hypothetical protein